MRTQMAKQRRKGSVNALPDIHLFGNTELDQVLNGGMTERLRSQIYKVNEPKASPFFTDRIPDLSPVAKPPLHAVLHRCFCQNCGHSHDTFAYLTRKITVTTTEGSLTSYKPIAHSDLNEIPASVELQQQTVPFCPNCIKVTV